MLCGGQRTTRRTLFCSSSTWVLVNKLIAPGLAAWRLYPLSHLTTRPWLRLCLSSLSAPWCPKYSVLFPDLPEEEEEGSGFEALWTLLAASRDGEGVLCYTPPSCLSAPGGFWHTGKRQTCSFGACSGFHRSATEGTAVFRGVTAPGPPLCRGSTHHPPATGESLLPATLSIEGACVTH